MTDDGTKKLEPVGAKSTADPQGTTGAKPLLIGVLVSHTWKEEGTLHEIREGRTLIGRGAGADIQVAQDVAMSDVHALILCRRDGNHEMIDKESLNGTYCNGEKLRLGQSVDLKDGDEIKAGNTTWTFHQLLAGKKPEAPQEKAASPAAEQGTKSFNPND